ncbi:MAG: GNAT family N-acetyltransferase [Planctomycetota bacterium]|jgi:ribosomal protein S18 acetylase RimI-like enzyme
MSDSIEIRRIMPAEADDVVELFALYRVFYDMPMDLEGSRAFLFERLERDESVVFGAYLDGTCVGFAQIYPAFSSVSAAPELILNDLYVHESARGRGVGEALCVRVLELGKEREASKVSLMTETTNEEAQRLYDRLGFSRVERYYTYIHRLGS